MNALKYLSNKKECPLCKGSLKQDKYDVYCSCCGLVVFDCTPPSANELDFILDLVYYNRIHEEESKGKKFPIKKFKIRLKEVFMNNEKY